MYDLERAEPKGSVQNFPFLRPDERVKQMCYNFSEVVKQDGRKATPW